MIVVPSYNARFLSSNNILTLLSQKSGEIDKEDTGKELIEMWIGSSHLRFPYLFCHKDLNVAN